MKCNKLDEERMNIKATIYKSKFPEQIHTTDKLYMEKLRKFYSNDIKIPKIHYSQLIQVLKQRYNISVIEIEESDLDNYTKDIMSDLLKNEHKLWKVLRNTYSDLFYKDFWDNYFEIDGKPELCIIYDFKEQEFMSNCRSIELLIKMEQGIDDIDSDEYLDYLNNLYFYNGWLWKCGF